MEIDWLPLVTRISTLSDLLNGGFDSLFALDERSYTYELALRDWLDHPFIGWGAGSFGDKYLYRSIDVPAWIGNLEIHALHDSGIIGFLGLMTALFGTLISLARAILRTPTTNHSQRGIMVGLLGACIGLLVAFQMTEATWLSYGWYVFGLSWTAASVANNGPVLAERGDQ